MIIEKPCTNIISHQIWVMGEVIYICIKWFLAGTTEFIHLYEILPWVGDWITSSPPKRRLKHLWIKQGAL